MRSTWDTNVRAMTAQQVWRLVKALASTAAVVNGVIGLLARVVSVPPVSEWVDVHLYNAWTLLAVTLLATGIIIVYLRQLDSTQRTSWLIPATILMASLMVPIVIGLIFPPESPCTIPSPTPSVASFTTPGSTPAATVRITKPQPCEHVDRYYTAQGIVQNGTTGKHMWLVVRYQVGYYPQGELPVDATAWSQAVVFGQEFDKGKKYTLYVVQADDSAAQQFSDWLAGASDQSLPLFAGKTYPGPGDAVTLATVDVVRR